MSNTPLLLFYLTERREPRKDPRDFYESDFCGYGSKSLSNILKHNKNLHNRKLNHPNVFTCHYNLLGYYKCENCDFETNLKVSLTNHFNLDHNGLNNQDQLRIVLRQCVSCDFQTYSSLLLLKHSLQCDDRENLGTHQPNSGQYKTEQLRKEAAPIRESLTTSGVDPNEQNRPKPLSSAERSRRYRMRKKARKEALRIHGFVPDEHKRPKPLSTTERTRLYRQRKKAAQEEALRIQGSNPNEQNRPKTLSNRKKTAQVEAIEIQNGIPNERIEKKNSMGYSYTGASADALFQWLEPSASTEQMEPEIDPRDIHKRDLDVTESLLAHYYMLTHGMPHKEKL